MSAAAEPLAKARLAFEAGHDLDARLLVASALSELSRPLKVKPVIVGGTAVDFYAAQSTPSGLRPSPKLRASLDVDVIVVGVQGDARLLRRALAGAGFSKVDNLPVDSARRWMPAGVPVLVEVLGGELAGDEEKIVVVEVDDGVAYLWGPEDTVWQYAENAWSQANRPDWERAVVVAAVQELDWDYLRDTVKRDHKPLGILASLRQRDSFDAMMESVHADGGAGNRKPGRRAPS